MVVVVLATIRLEGTADDGVFQPADSTFTVSTEALFGVVRLTLQTQGVDRVHETLISVASVANPSRQPTLGNPEVQDATTSLGSMWDATRAAELRGVGTRPDGLGVAG